MPNEIDFVGLVLFVVENSILVLVATPFLSVLRD